MPSTYDAIIIGAGLNGLTTAAYLAKGGQRVLVLERRASIGGVAVTEEFPDAPGFKFDTVTHNIAGFDPRIAQDLALERFGLELMPTSPAVYAPAPDGQGLTLWADDGQTTDSLRRFSTRDGQRWKPFRRRMAQLARMVEAINAVTPPSVTSTSAENLLPLGTLGLKLRGLGKRDMIEFLRMMPMPVYDLLDDEFENELLKGVLGAGGIRGMMLGPRGAGTTYNLLRQVDHGVIRATTLVRGGIGKLAEALAGAAQAHGAEIRTSAEVIRVLTREERADGVELVSGQKLFAARVVSSADPRRTFQQFLDPFELEPSFNACVRHIRMRGCVAKVNLALDSLPVFKGTTVERLCGTISISPSLDVLEHAYDDAKYGKVSQHPYLEIVIPSLNDPSRAPAGKHVMSIWVQYAPYKLATGDWRLEKETFAERVVKSLEPYVLNLQSLIIRSHVLTPCDLEETYGLTEGHLQHGETTLSQFLFMRPVPGWARYRAPIEGLYLCGSGTHPGGIPCAAGRNAAREILRGE